MFRAIVADAVFFAALFLETLALLSILQTVYGLELRDEFTPLMQFYHAFTAPFALISSGLFAGKLPGWYPGAALIAAVLFFLFFIKQARNAMAPYDGPDSYPDTEITRLDAAIDLMLPAAFCAIGSGVTAPVLLSFSTVPVALWLLLKRLFGKPSWFEVSPSYYINIVLLGAITAGLFALADLSL